MNTKSKKKDATPQTQLDYSRFSGGAALGARIRRLSDMIDRDSTRIYNELGIAFEQRWFGVLNQLILNGPMTVGEIASALRITHVSVSESVSSLRRVNVITSSADPADGRRRLLELTKIGLELVKKLTPLWKVLDAVSSDLNDEVGDAISFLDRLDDALAKRSMFDRITERFDNQHPSKSKPTKLTR